jgi:hypothetical protein
MVKFSEVMNASLEWTATVLFRPFSPKKWLVLGFVAIMAGYMSGGNYNFNDSNTNKKAQAAQEAVLSAPADPAVIPAGTGLSDQEVKTKEILGEFRKPANSLWIPAIIIVVFLLIILFSWLASRFSFVFLENLTRNEALVRVPFRNNRNLGNSLFIFSLAILAIFLAIFGIIFFLCFNSLNELGVFADGAKPGMMTVILACFPYFLISLAVLMLMMFYGFLMNNFIVAIMYKDKTGPMHAWKNFWALFNPHKGEFIKYFFIKIGLSIASAFIYGMLCIVAYLGLLLPGGLIALIAYLLYLLVPGGLHLAYFITLGIVLTPVVLLVLYCLLCLNLPFAVFLRTFSLKFLGRLEGRYNLFVYN